MAPASTAARSSSSKSANANANNNNSLAALDNTTRITSPAIVALVGYVLLAIVVLLPFEMYTYDPRRRAYVKAPYNFAQRLLVVIMLFFPFFLGVYSVNCMMVGECRLWSWIVAVATIVWAVLVLVTAIHYQAFRLDDMVA